MLPDAVFEQVRPIVAAFGIADLPAIEEGGDGVRLVIWECDAFEVDETELPTASTHSHHTCFRMQP